MDDLIDQMKKTLATLTAERNELTRRIDILDRAVRELRGDVVVKVPPAELNVSAHEPVVRSAGWTVRDLIMETARTNEEFGMTVVAALGEARGKSINPDTISSLLSRLKRDGDLGMVRRGVYRLATSEASASAEASVDTSAAVGSAVPDLEGGEGHDGDHDLDRHAAPVAGN